MEKTALTVKEACSHLGMTKSSLYRARERGEISLRKLGGRTVILKADIEAWIGSLPVAERRPSRPSNRA